MDRLLDEAFASQRFESAMETVVFPALRSVGDAWAAGDIDVAGEHVASETIERRLARQFDAARRDDRAPSVVIGLPPGAHHEIGAFAFAVAARRIGIDALYVGADVPLESWVRTAGQTGVRVAVQAVVTPADVGAATRVIESVRSRSRDVTCAVGGASASRVRVTGGVVLLPDSLDLAVEVVAEILGPDQAPPG
jgi:methanogenic corrinoid protein MtbC1